MPSVGIGIADIMPARSFLIPVARTVEIHPDAEHIILVKGLIDTDGGIPLEFSRVLKPRVIHRDRTVEILPTFYREHDIRPLLLIGREKLNRDILRGKTFCLFDALLDVPYVEDISLVEGKEILPVKRIAALCETNGANIADEEDETEFSGGEILLRYDNTARGEATSHEGLIHRIDKLVDVAERQLLILVRASDTFEEAESLHLVLNRDLRDVESNALICGKICRRGRGNNRLHTLLTESLLPCLLLRSRLVELLLLGRGGDNRDGREGEEGDEE